VVWEVLQAALAETGGRELTIVDAGGGTGGIAVPLAHAGHRVTVVDPNPDALAGLARRAAEHGLSERVAGVQGELADLTTFFGAATVDLVLCHAVLDTVEGADADLAPVATVLRPGGRLSLLVAGRAAAVLARALAGHPDEAAHVLTDPLGRWGPTDPAARRWTPEALAELVAAVGLTVEQVHGVRTVADLVPAAVVESAPAALVALERALADQAPFRDLATQLHLLARR
jgi:SAM-dependent methyltransferase